MCLKISSSTASGFDNPVWPTLTANFGPPCGFSVASGPRPESPGKTAPHTAWALLS